MQRFYIHPLGCAIVILIFGHFFFKTGSFSSKLNSDQPIPVKHDEPKIQQKLEISEKIERKHRILKRGCSMMRSLFEMSQNGTSYENLITWHARIHDLNYPLGESQSNEDCFPPLQSPNTNLVFYRVPDKGPNTAALFCLPPKCGTTSYQKALVQHITHILTEKRCNSEDEMKINTNPENACFNQFFLQHLKNKLRNLNANREFVEKIGNEKIVSDEVRSPAVYWFMNFFKEINFVNPMTFLDRNGTTTPIYHELQSSEKRILNTRNPFSRLYAAWGDKFRTEYYEGKIVNGEAMKLLKALLPLADRAEPADSEVPLGKTNSFHGFLRYVTQEQGEQHLNRHWRSIVFLCQPCRFVYDYIMDIEFANDDSEYVFQQLNFDAKLPSFHQSSKSTKKTIDEYYKKALIPKALIKKVYAKYYLDFVLFGFSPDSVKTIVDAGTDEPSEYSFKTYKGFDSQIFSQNRKVIYRLRIIV